MCLGVKCSEGVGGEEIDLVERFRESDGEEEAEDEESDDLKKY